MTVPTAATPAGAANISMMGAGPIEGLLPQVPA